MAQIITLADWCPPDIARRVAGWAGSRRIYIDLTDDGKLHCLPNSGTPLNVPLPRGVTFAVAVKSIARQLGCSHVDVWRDYATGREWRAKLAA